MIGTIRAVWPGKHVTMIIARDGDASRDVACFVFMPEGQWIAALCETAAWNGKTQPAPLVLTLEPKTRYGYKIIDAELMPELRNASTYVDQAHGPAQPVAPQGTLADVQMEMDVHHGKDWHDI